MRTAPMPRKGPPEGRAFPRRTVASGHATPRQARDDTARQVRYGKRSRAFDL